MKPTEFTIAFKNEDVLAEIQKLKEDIKPLVESIMWAAVEEIKWICKT